MIRSLFALVALLALGLGSGAAFAGPACGGPVEAGTATTVASTDGSAPTTPVIIPKPKTDG